MVKYTDIEIGSTIVVKGSFGLDPAQTVIVTDKHRNIKNGFAGIDYTSQSGSHGWAYMDQIVQVIKK